MKNADVSVILCLVFEVESGLRFAPPLCENGAKIEVSTAQPSERTIQEQEEEVLLSEMENTFFFFKVVW